MTPMILKDRYRLEDELGKGGMGVVYRARDLLLERPVAVKILSRLDLGSAGRARLLAEARAAAQLNHPNIVSIHDAGEVDESPFIVMELVEGQTLRRSQPGSLEDSLWIARQLCAALEHAHAAGIIHRDIKPENVLLTKSQTAKLVDFGLACTPSGTRLTEDGVLVGTIAYLAPELILGGAATIQSDLYAFGVLLYELIAGCPPFAADTFAGLLAQHLYAPATPPSAHNPAIPYWLDELALQLMNKEPAERPASAAEVLRALDQAADSRGIEGHSEAKGNLPRQLTRLIGREKEIIQVVELVRQNALVTLVGSGGVGKTRLSLAAAEALQKNGFKDGVWLVELAPVADPAVVSKAIAGTLGVVEEANRPLADTLCFWLRSRDVLLVLDNCEHLIEACAALTETLLRAAPRLKVLATSREALGVSGEVRYRAPSLTFPAPGQVLSTPEQLLQYEAERLFLERAQAALPEFQITPENMNAVVDICQRLDGIPLAIELAAARMSALDAVQVAARLDSAFRLLVGGKRGTIERHRTLRVAIDWSYNLLSAQERCLFRRLAVFAGGAGLAAIEAVCAGDQVEEGEALDLLGQLVHKSMVQVERQADGEARYRLLEMARQYAWEKLAEAGEEEVLRDRQRDYFVQLAEIIEYKIITAERLIWTRRLKADLDNFRAAIRWSYSRQEAEAGLRIAAALTFTLGEHGGAAEVLQWLVEGLKIGAGLADQPLLHARALTAAGRMAHFCYHFSSARQWYEASVPLCRSIGAAANRDLCESLMGLVYGHIFGFWSNKWQEINALLEESMAVARKLEPRDRWYQARCLLEGFDIIQVFHNPDAEEAKRTCEEYARLLAGTGDIWSAVAAFITLGRIALKQKDFYQMESHFRRAIALCQEAGNHSLLTGTYWWFGNCYRESAAPQKSIKCFQEHLRLQESKGYIEGILVSLSQLGWTFRDRSDAIKPQDRSLRLAAVLWGMVDHLNRQYGGGNPSMPIGVGETFTILQGKMDAADLSAAWAEGQAVSIEQAIAFAHSLKVDEDSGQLADLPPQGV